MSLLHFWLASQALFATLILFCHFTDGIDWNKDNVMAMVFMFICGPLALLGITVLFTHEHVRDKKRMRCRAITSAWESKSKAKSGINNWNWHMDKGSQEERYNLLRETIRSISDKDLEFLAKVDEDTYGIDKPLLDAIMDEILERRILSND